MTVTDASPDYTPYVPLLVREWIDGDDPDTKHRVLEGSTIFADVSGFTTMTERLGRSIGREGAEEVTELIGHTFSLLLESAYGYGGILIKFGGDALFLFFRGADHEQRAASAALEMRRTIRGMGSFETPAGKVTLGMSQGVHSGIYHFFVVGSEFRELIVAGATATQLARLEGAANTGQIIVSDVTGGSLPAANLGAVREGGRLLRGRLLPLGTTRQEVYTARSDISRYVPVALRNLIAQDGVVSEHRPVTSAFIRLTGVDALLEEDAEAMAEIFEELIDDVQAAIGERDIALLNTDVYPDGIKIHLTGGAPITTGADEENMLLAVREIVDKERPLPLHVGVTEAPAFAGEIGATFRRSYTVMGDQVNLAARLMSRAGDNQILATGAVLEGSRTLFATEELEPFPVKGKTELITAYVIGEPRGTKVDTSGDETPFIGRSEELDALFEHWEQTKAGHGSVVLVSGAAGMGKSRLLAELSGRSDAHAFQAVCRRYRAATPYFAARLMLWEILAIDRYDEEAAAKRLARIVEAVDPELVPYLSLIGTAVGLDLPESDEVAALGAEFRKPRLEASVEALLTGLLTEPTLLSIDDAQWMDEASIELFATLSTVAQDRPWLIVASGRGVEKAAAKREFTAPIITVGPLSDEEATTFVHRRTDEAPLPQHVTAEIVDRANGNPMFLNELLGAMDADDVEALPESVEGVIAARIDRLLPEDRNALRQLSVLGLGFKPEFAGVVLSEPASPTVFKRLAEFLDVDADWVKFGNSLVHDAAYSGLPYRQRRALHGQVAESIERTDGGADLLSVHYHAAGRWPEAWRYSRIAGDHAKGIYANLEAASFYERALESARYVAAVEDSDRVQILTALGDVREQSGSFDSALDAYRKASRLVSDESVDRADLHLKRARARVRVGSYPAALRETTSGYRTVEGRDDREAGEAKARISAFAAGIRLQQGEPGKALELAERAMEQARLYDEWEALAQAYTVLDGASEMLGAPERAVYAEQAREIYDEIGDLVGVAVVENNVAVRAYDEGRWDEAIEAYTASQEALRRVGNMQHAAAAGANIGEVLVSQHRLEEADATLTEAIRDLRAYNLVELLGFAEIQQARLEMERGNLDQAVTQLSQIYADAAAGGRNDDALEAAIYLSEALVRSGLAERALETLDEAEDRAGEEALFYEASLLRVRAQALAGVGDLEGSLALTEQGLVVAREHGLPYEEALLLRTKGEVSRLAGGDDGAEAVQEAERLLHRLGVTQVL